MKRTAFIAIRINGKVYSQQKLEKMLPEDCRMVSARYGNSDNQWDCGFHIDLESEEFDD